MIVAWPPRAFEQLGGIDKATYIAVLTHDPKLDDAALEIALRSDAARTTTSIASGGGGPQTIGTPGLTIPAFSAAIDASVSPSCAWWSVCARTG